jgi:hypothetical protein
MIPWTAAKVEPPEGSSSSRCRGCPSGLVRTPEQFPPEALPLVPLVHGEVGEVGAVGEVGDRP